MSDKLRSFMLIGSLVKSQISLLYENMNFWSLGLGLARPIHLIEKKEKKKVELNSNLGSFYTKKYQNWNDKKSPYHSLNLKKHYVQGKFDVIFVMGKYSSTIHMIILIELKVNNWTKTQHSWTCPIMS